MTLFVMPGMLSLMLIVLISMPFIMESLSCNQHTTQPVLNKKQTIYNVARMYLRLYSKIILTNFPKSIVKSMIQNTEDSDWKESRNLQMDFLNVVITEKGQRVYNVIILSVSTRYSYPFPVNDSISARHAVKKELSSLESIFQMKYYYGFHTGISFFHFLKCCDHISETTKSAL